jgi:AraC-like DNA-binding protein
MPGSTPARAWATDQVPPHEQFAVWREVVREAFVPVALARSSSGPFPSAVNARTVGAMAVSRIVSQSQTVMRTTHDIARAAGDVFFLNLPLTPGASAEQDGRETRLEPGDFVLVDSTRPFELRFERQFEQISLTLPHESLAGLLAAPHEATAVRVPGDQGVGAVASSAIQALARSGVPHDRHAARALADHLAGLIALSLGGVQAPPVPAGRSLLMQAALDEVERSLGDPVLGPSSAAERVGISTRYLHRLFAERGTSFGRWVLTRRLERCQRDLEDPQRIHWTVAEIAFTHGFRDPSYFARAFKARHGQAPAEYRRSVVRASHFEHATGPLGEGALPDS